ncbi:hypothetical protein [Undibacterium sp. TS12]|uniref:hypothetical protein n=1 Tax=Undibacterium sp. TS12 TaxID=2908202 RepID=UPI001F4C6475|nr:hypothetical protein [Undibacterium sp. TS12]MCH8621075.1 hypothetical protein [Undibacterium sp. TS12]
MNNIKSFVDWLFVSVLGRLLVITSVLIGLFTLYTNFYPDKAQVKAMCQSFDYVAIPKDLFNTEILAPNSGATDSKSGAKEVKKNNIQKVEPAEELKKFRKTVTDLLMEIPSERPSSVLHCFVTNSGTQEAKDVVLDTPDDIVAVKLNEEVQHSDKKAKKSINLGVIRPKGKINLMVWTGASYLSKDDEEYTLSFSGGERVF